MTKNPWDSYDNWRTDVPNFLDDPTPNDFMDMFDVRCPKCSNNKDFSSVYLLQHEENESRWYTLKVHCKKCDHEWTEEINTPEQEKTV